MHTEITKKKTKQKNNINSNKHKIKEVTLRRKKESRKSFLKQQQISAFFIHCRSIIHSINTAVAAKKKEKYDKRINIKMGK